MQVLSKLAALTALATSVDAHFIQSVLVFTRHGDRTSKFYKGYEMTALGAQQVYQSGQFYRERYLTNSSSSNDSSSTHSHAIQGISRTEAVASQIWASAPDQHVLYQTATNFLQGLYPPLPSAEEELNNGSSVAGPLGGYQYILVHGEDTESPDTIWIKGDDECPAYDTATKSYKQSAEYKATLNSSQDFYARFVPQVGSILGGAQNVSYAKAYEVFDLINVASIHNRTITNAPFDSEPFSVAPADLDQLRYYADEWEWNSNFNASQPDRSIGGMTLAGGILRQLQAVVAGSAKTKFSLMAGSYDTFLSFFGLAGLQDVSPQFMGLPHYAASMAFELFTEESTAFSVDDLHVRFLFRNGTDADEALEPYPLFGEGSTAMPWADFVEKLGGKAISTVADWCATCGATADFCVAANETAAAGAEGNSSSSGGSSLSNAAAGGIGAAVALAVVGLIGAALWLVRRRRSSRAAARQGGIVSAADPEKRLSVSDSGSDRKL